MKDYQQDGFVRGFTTQSLAEANQQVAVARSATPLLLQDSYRSQIRKCFNGYNWYWVKK